MKSSSNGLVLEGTYAFSVETIAESPNDAALVFVDKENEKFLRTSTIWHDPIEAEETDSIGLELRRQDLKINLLVDMVSELLAQNSVMPPHELIRLTPMGIEFTDNTHKFKEGALGMAKLYIQPAFPKPLQFYGEFVASERDGHIVLRFNGTSGTVQDQIEKLLFTHHRRSIALELANSQATGA